MIPQLKTQRLILRGFCEADLDAYADMCAHPEVMRYIGAGQPLSREESWRNMAMIVGHWQLRGYGLWAVEESQTGEMIGRIGFWQPEGWPGFEIGWSLRWAYWGRGFATEAATVAINYAFTQLQRSHIISLIHPQNTASVRVAQKLGEKLQGTTEIFKTEVLVYGLSREDWQKM
ncbi:GCN5-related N-acetyltransferase [Nostoc sp. HK-01]|uniref:GCN5-related N-acetyltransferase n=2 Tax=Nostocales TaxID=1161 RepID=A0A1Z4GHQ2_9CYAN|nr:GNAT family N-acetyltransferase [Nostoc cycadae]BAY17009.1 GCN5-related N-acetyltransferase [Anabaenopsis circularis NIES-21]BBD58885.1 GCN5-related N-acetyltransferase [Nostoc sp. HK-01]GBE91962.1 N-acetyltransferase GCN5 [Nostoc cycadae WK-1]